MKKIDITPEQERFCKNFVEVILDTPAVIREIVKEHFDPSQHGDLGLTVKKGKWNVDLRVDGEWYNLYSYDVQTAGQDKFRELISLLSDAADDAQEDEDDNDDDDDDEDEEAAKEPRSNLEKEVEELKNYLADKGVYV